MRKMNFIIACGTLAAIGTWQLASMAQQPRHLQSKTDTLEHEEFDVSVEQQIQILTEQAAALAAEAESLSRDANRNEGGNREERHDRKRLDPNVQDLQAKTQALAQLVKQMQEAKIQESKARGRADEAQRRAQDIKIKQKVAAWEKTQREPRVDQRAPIRAESRIAQIKEQFKPQFAQAMRNMMIQDQNGMRMVVQDVVASPEDAKRLDEFRNLVNDYRKEKDGQRKEELKGEIREKLESQLDRDIDSRKTQLSQMEQRVEKLREQLEKSENSKSATVDSLLQMLDGENTPFGISPAWIDALSVASPAGPYQHSLNGVGPDGNGAKHILAAPLAIDLGMMPSVNALPQISVGIVPPNADVADPTSPVGILPSIPGGLEGTIVLPKPTTQVGILPSVPGGPEGTVVLPKPSVAPDLAAPPAPPEPEALDRPEVPEQAEQPEQPEQPEAPELPELPEPESN